MGIGRKAGYCSPSTVKHRLKKRSRVPQGDYAIYVLSSFHFSGFSLRAITPYTNGLKADASQYTDGQKCESEIYFQRAKLYKWIVGPVAAAVRTARCRKVSWRRNSSPRGINFRQTQRSRPNMDILLLFLTTICAKTLYRLLAVSIGQRGISSQLTRLEKVVMKASDFALHILPQIWLPLSTLPLKL